MLVFRLGDEHRQLVGEPAVGLDPLAHPARDLGLGPPVDVVLEPALPDVTLLAARDVRRRDVQVVRPAATGLHRREQVERAVDVGGEPLVDRRVERHLSGAVDDDVEVTGQRRDVGEVTLEDGDPGPDEGVDPGLAELVPQPRVGRALQLLGDAVLRRHAGTAAHQDDDGGIRQVVQQALEQRLADEAGGSGQQDPPAG